MSKAFTFEIQGAEKLINALLGLPDKVSKTIVEKAMKEALKPVKAKVRELAPRRTGAMASSVRVKTTRRKGGKLGVVVSIGKGFFKGKSFYGAFQEFGTRFMKGSHFMRRASKQTRQAASERAVALITEGIQQYLNGIS